MDVEKVKVPQASPKMEQQIGAKGSVLYGALEDDLNSKSLNDDDEELSSIFESLSSELQQGFGIDLQPPNTNQQKTTTPGKTRNMKTTTNTFYLETIEIKSLNIETPQRKRSLQGRSYSFPSDSSDPEKIIDSQTSSRKASFSSSDSKKNQEDISRSSTEPSIVQIAEALASTASRNKIPEIENLSNDENRRRSSSPHSLSSSPRGRTDSLSPILNNATISTIEKRKMKLKQFFGSEYQTLLDLAIQEKQAGTIRASVRKSREGLIIDNNNNTATENEKQKEQESSIEEADLLEDEHYARTLVKLTKFFGEVSA
jgi:hypothetical protein